MSTTIVKQQVIIHASPSTVWSKLTDPDETEKYFFKTRVHSLWTEGSSISFTRKLLGIFTFKLSGTIMKIEKEKLLEYTLKKHVWFGEPASFEFSLVTITLTPDGDTTIVAICDHVGDYKGAEKRYAKSVKGWEKILHGLKEITEMK